MGELTPDHKGQKIALAQLFKGRNNKSWDAVLYTPQSVMFIISK